MTATAKSITKGMRLREEGTDVPIFTVDRVDPTGAWVSFQGDRDSKAFFMNAILAAMEIVEPTDGPGRAA